MNKLTVVQHIQREIAEIDSMLETNERLNRELGKDFSSELMMNGIRHRREQLLAEMKALQGEDE